MVVIELTQGQFAVVDDQDSDLGELPWYAMRPGGRRKWYAVRNCKVDGKWRQLHLQRVVADRMGIQGRVGQVDMDALNCQRDNLRSTTRSQTGASSSGASLRKSGFKGVVWNGDSNRWAALIRTRAGRKTLGYFLDPSEAAAAYDRAAIKEFGAYAYVNLVEHKNVRSEIPEGYRLLARGPLSQQRDYKRRSTP